MIRKLEVFEFEIRKKVILAFKELSKLKDMNCRSDILVSFNSKTNLTSLVMYLITIGRSNEETLGGVGQIIKIFAKSKVAHKPNKGNI